MNFTNGLFALLAIAVATTVVDGSSVATPPCVDVGAGVIVGFDIDNPQQNDWVALFRPDQVANGFAPDPIGRNWANTCGAQNCFQFPQNNVFMITEPNIEPGTWVAALMRWDGASAAPYQVVAVSTPFSVDNQCIPPTPAPVPTAPTPFPTLKPLTLPTLPPVPTDIDFRTAPFPDDVVHLDQLTFEFGEGFGVSVDLPEKILGDWIAIFGASEDMNDLPAQGLLWLSAYCNEQDTSNSCGVASGGPSEVIFGGSASSEWASEWPLPPGIYKAVALRGEQPARGESWISAGFESKLFSIVRTTTLNPFAMIQLRMDIRKTIEEDEALAAKYIRLGFHDCVGGCDGCVDMAFHENAGLDRPIDALEPVYARNIDLFSRADVWAVATMVGAEMSQPRDFFGDVDFRFELWTHGRTDCDDAGLPCVDENGAPAPCTFKRGTHREIPGMNLGTHEVFDFFQEDFGFDMRDTVTLMGAHTLGQLARNNSGVDGEHGWVSEKRLLDNEYYFEIVGFSSTDDINSLINFAPNWEREVVDNSDIPDTPDRHVWTADNPDAEGPIIMLNTDIALVRDLNPSNLDPITGEVSCKFVLRSEGTDPVCPHVEGAIQVVSEFNKDGDLWLAEFEAILERMVHNGNVVTDRCVQFLCEVDSV